MFIVEPAQANDIDDLMALAIEMAPGITTFPPNKTVLTNKISKSCDAFDLSISDSTTPRDFLLVLRDLSNNKVIGTAGVFSHIGAELPFYSYKRTTSDISTQIDTPETKELITTSIQTLNLSHDMEGGTEVGTLLLLPSYNGLGLGKLLAKARYLLIRTCKRLFSEPIFAELRGKTEPNDISPFWQAVGRKFMNDMEFSKADYLSAVTDKQFIDDLFPKHAIYEALLPDDARQCIGKANSKGQGALKMLFDEGFKDEGYVDIFDAGITVTARMNDLHTITHTKSMTVAITEEVTQNENSLLIATESLSDFRVLQTDLFNIVNGTIEINQELCERLLIQEGDSVSVYSLN